MIKMICSQFSLLLYGIYCILLYSSVLFQNSNATLNDILAKYLDNANLNDFIFHIGYLLFMF